MKNRLFASVVLLLLIAGGMLVALRLVNAKGLAGTLVRTSTLAHPQQIGAAQSSAVQIVGGYSGIVELNNTVAGVYSDTLAIPPAPGAGTPPPPDLGSVDLSLQLTQTGNLLSGYVNLDKTLIFSVEHTLGSGAASLKIGPYVKGAFDGTTLVLASEQVSIVASGRSVQRQFRLTGTIVNADGNQISGEYRETLWGYTPFPVTVIGAFSLQRPNFTSSGTVNGNKAPVTVADSASAVAGQAVSINVLANDSDPNNDALTILSLSKPQFGTAVINGQSVLYTPNAGFSGNDTFTYLVGDGKGGTTASSVTITVTGNGNPTATPIPGGNVYLPLVSR